MPVRRRAGGSGGGMRPSAGPPPTPEGRGRHESEHRWPGRRRQPPVRDHAAPRPIPDPISHQYPQPPRHAIGQQCANSSADSVRQSSVVTYAVRCAVCRRRPSDIQSRQCASAVNFVENPPACCFCRLRHAPSGPVRQNGPWWSLRPLDCSQPSRTQG